MGQIVRAEVNRIIRSDVDPRFFLEFLNCKVGKPQMLINSQFQKLTPMQCRQSDLTYSAPILVDIEYLRGGTVVRRMNEEIGRLPVMLRSACCWMWQNNETQITRLGECPRDPGGYFVVKGQEKVILMQEQMSKNRIIVEFDFKKCLCATVSSVNAETKSRTQTLWKNNRVYVRHNSFTDELPAVIVLKAMGIETDQEILQMIGTNKHHAECIHLSMQEAIESRVLSQRQGLIYVGSRIRQKSWIKDDGKKTENMIIDEAIDMMHKMILSHIPTTGNDFRQKSRYMCLMIRRVFDAILDKTLLDDKDYYGNKRLELSGQLLGYQFEDKFKTWREDFKRRIDDSLRRYMTKKSQSTSAIGSALDFYPDVLAEKPSDSITKGMQTALSTGNWNIKRFKMEKSGVAQTVSRFSYIAALGIMTRLVGNVEKGMKLAGPRWLQPSQFGMLCPCDTPEGEGIGIVKNLSLMTQVTTDEDDVPLRRLAYNLGVEDVSCLSGEELHDTGSYLIFLNGTLLGIHRRPRQFMTSWRNLRRSGDIGGFISIYEAHQAIYIASDGGRLCRPLIIVDDQVPRLKVEQVEMVKKGELSFFDFLRNGVLEWIDVNEENNTVIAMREENISEHSTHLEIDPLTIMGVVSGLVPYPHHNQSPRNTYQCAMGKQAMGVMAYNQFTRVDNVLYLLVYPQRQLCKSKTIELAGLDKLPAGHAASVAVMSYSGYDIEDAIIMNRNAIDRGFGRCYVIKRFAVELKSGPGAPEITHPPPPPKLHSKVDKRFEVLESDGIARVGAMISTDQIYANKYIPAGANEPGAQVAYHPQPVRYKTPVPSYVDRVILTENSEGNTLYKFMFRQTRPPELGDKFSSRHGQKGVVGCIVSHEDFPFSEKGWTPDMIMNPHGFPSRMTVGKMIELIAGKSALFDGELKYGTAFGGTKVKDIAQVLIANGFHYSGKDYLTSGITGEPLQTYVFNGPIFYQKLKHMVQDKIHARGIGPRALLTRQPTEGRSKMGGLRLGEMERDCLVAYG